GRGWKGKAERRNCPRQAKWAQTGQDSSYRSTGQDRLLSLVQKKDRKATGLGNRWAGFPSDLKSAYPIEDFHEPESSVHHEPVGDITGNPIGGLFCPKRSIYWPNIYRKKGS